MEYVEYLIRYPLEFVKSYLVLNGLTDLNPRGKSKLMLDAWAIVIISALDYMSFVLLKYVLDGKFYRHSAKIGLPYYILTCVACLCNGMVITVVLDKVFREDHTLSTYIVSHIGLIGMLFEIGAVIMLAVVKNVYKERDELNRQYICSRKHQNQCIKRIS